MYLSARTEPPRPPLYTDSIATSLQSAMYGVNSTAYVRVPFIIEGPDDVNDLKLRLKYDDGFVAYLNGTELTRVGVTGNPPMFSGPRAFGKECPFAP